MKEMAWLAKTDGSVVVGHGPFRQTPLPDSGEVAFYKRCFHETDDSPWYLPARVEHLSLSQFQDTMSHQRGPIRMDWETPDAMPFSIVFQEIMSCIAQGSIEKTVPVVTERGRLHDEEGIGRIIAAMSGQKAPLHTYGWVMEDSGFSGATPELLFSIDGLNLRTMALAGTARQEDEPVFRVDEKEIREHEYVAQTLVAKLSDLGKLSRKERKVLRLESIVHFLTPISVELGASQEPVRLMKRLHPTPALGPLPRTDESMAMLRNWRKRLNCPPEFGAPFGVWDCGAFEAVVAIRGLWWNKRNVSLPAGCGIIEASRLVNEWRELRLKREAVKRFLM